MEDKDYVLTIRVPFKAADDIDAREYAKSIFSIDSPNGVNLKLQEIFVNKAPRGVNFLSDYEIAGLLNTDKGKKTSM
jgi:hypothetical protein